MRLYVDFLDTDRCFRAGQEAFVDPSLPLAVLRSTAFLAASRVTSTGAPTRLYHVERGRYVREVSAAAAGLDEHDTLVLVSARDGDFPAADEVRLRWCAAGGAARRCAHMPPPAYALAANAARYPC